MMVPDVHDITFYVFTLYSSLCSSVLCSQPNMKENTLPKISLKATNYSYKKVRSKQETKTTTPKIVLVLMENVQATCGLHEFLTCFKRNHVIIKHILYRNTKQTNKHSQRTRSRTKCVPCINAII